jgi:hypothetical protein
MTNLSLRLRLGRDRDFNTTGLCWYPDRMTFILPPKWGIFNSAFAYSQYSSLSFMLLSDPTSQSNVSYSRQTRIVSQPAVRKRVSVITLNHSRHSFYSGSSTARTTSPTSLPNQYPPVTIIPRCSTVSASDGVQTSIVKLIDCDCVRLVNGKNRKEKQRNFYSSYCKTNNKCRL